MTDAPAHPQGPASEVIASPAAQAASERAQENLPSPIPASAVPPARSAASQAQPASAASAPTAATPIPPASRPGPPREGPLPSQAMTAPPNTAASQPIASAPAPSAKPPPPVGIAAGFYINVGVFADEANARKTQARLLNEGLPAFRQEVFIGNQRRLQVRVGPFGKRAEADAVATTIRAMSLDAVVARQGT